jgi:hypothetical protein
MLVSRMTFIKYAVALTLALASWEATRHVLGIGFTPHAILAATFCAYALGTLLLLKPTENPEAEDAQTNTEGAFEGSVARLAARTLSLVLFRTAFLLAALAYAAQIMHLFDATFVKAPPSPGFSSFLITVFDATIPPLAALSQFLFPEVQPATLNVASVAALAFKLFVYLAYGVLLVSVVKGVWSLGYRARYVDLQWLVEQNRLLGAAPPPRVRADGLDLPATLERELAKAEAAAHRSAMPELGHEDYQSSGYLYALTEFAKKKGMDSEVIGMAWGALEIATNEIRTRKLREGAWDHFRTLERLYQLNIALSQLPRLAGEFHYETSGPLVRRYAELCFRFAKWLGVEIRDPHPSSTEYHLSH